MGLSLVLFKRPDVIYVHPMFVVVQCEKTGPFADGACNIFERRLLFVGCSGYGTRSKGVFRTGGLSVHIPNVSLRWSWNLDVLMDPMGHLAKLCHVIKSVSGGREGAKQSGGKGLSRPYSIAVAKEHIHRRKSEGGAGDQDFRAVTLILLPQLEHKENSMMKFSNANAFDTMSLDILAYGTSIASLLYLRVDVRWGLAMAFKCGRFTRVWVVPGPGLPGLRLCSNRIGMSICPNPAWSSPLSPQHTRSLPTRDVPSQTLSPDKLTVFSSEPSTCTRKGYPEFLRREALQRTVDLNVWERLKAAPKPFEVPNIHPG
nr:hypothetical protein Iba_chr09cCG8910 [Ipomoea batatas]